jgi:hypothetical protein
MENNYVVGLLEENKIEIHTDSPIMDSFSLERAKELKKKNKKFKIYKLVEIK